MYTIHLTSGLGNQLFQFFFGESIKIENPKIQIRYKDSLLPPNQLRITDIFNSPLDSIIKNSNKNLINIFQINLIKGLIKLNINNFFNIYSDNTFSLIDSNSFKINEVKTLYGYWQNYNYFKDNFEQIRKQLKFKSKVSIRDFDHLKHFSEIVGIHFRGGDYKNYRNKKLFFQVDKKYYEQSIKKILKILKNPIFIFFTDDYFSIIDVVRNLDIEHFFIKDLSQNRKDDFQLLSQCDHYILPNSTFSLWAAYLNKKRNKIVITPDQWFQDNKFKFEFYNYDWFSKI